MKNLSNLDQAIYNLKHLDRNLKPVQLANSREDALVKGLHRLAEAYNKKIDFTRIDANGEMNFNISNGRYGEELANVISRVPRRTGIYPTESPALPVNNWCRIHHFDVEHLLLSLDPDHPI